MEILNTFTGAIRVSPIFIDGFLTTYWVTSTGHVYNINYRGSGITQRLKEETNHGYKRVMLVVNGKKLHKRVHRLVAEAFIPNPNNLPVCHHKDNDKTNNHLSNLEWTTFEENTQFAYDDGLYRIGEDHPMNKYSEEQIHLVCKLLEENELTIPEIAKMSNTTHAVVTGVLLLGEWQHVSKKYNIKNYNKRVNAPKLPDEIIIRICELLEKGTFKVVQIATICNVSHYIVSDIKKHKTYLNISSKFNF
jgi:hypothetical protein